MLKTEFIKNWKTILSFLLLTLLSLGGVYLSGICGRAFEVKIINMLLLLPAVIALICLSCNFDTSEHSRKRTSLCWITLLSLLILALIRNFHWVTGGIKLPGVILVYDKFRSTGYFFSHINLSPVVTSLVLANVLNLCNKKLSKRDLMFFFADFILLLAIGIKYAWIFAVAAFVTHYVLSRKPLRHDKLNMTILAVSALISTLLLVIEFSYEPYILRDDFSLIQTATMILIPVICAAVSLICAYRNRKAKYLTIGIFIALSVIVMPHISLLFNGMILGVLALLILVQDSDESKIFSEYAKWLILKKQPSIQKRIFDISPKSTITTASLSDLLSAVLIGSNEKYSIVSSILKETDLSDDADNCFDLLIIKALFSQHCDNGRENIYFSKAKKLARGNVELFIVNYFSNPHDIDLLDDIREDLDGVLKEECEKRILSFESIRKKFDKLKH